MIRTEIAALIARRIRAVASSSAQKFADTAGGIGHFVVDDLLPQELALEIAKAFPTKSAMIAKKSLRERKAVMARMAECSPLVGEAIYAFHAAEVVDLIGAITGTPSVQPDPYLYAGGISAMGRGDFLNPHLDNSHDKDRARWRAFNLLYYVAPEWPEDAGGDLELWPQGVGGERIAIHSRFNRLAVMSTHGQAWHSVSPITQGATRMCVSNYYFTPAAPRQADKFHVTSFRGRPGEPILDAALVADSLARQFARRLAPSGLRKTTHINSPH